MPNLDKGIKVSKNGFNVLDPDKAQKKVQSSNNSPLDYLLYALAMPYLYGAKQQVNRYQIAAKKLESMPVLAVYECLHESSTLFEDLNTVARYIDKCGDKNDRHEIWLDVRNHIRHDIREEFNRETSERKNNRTKRLKIHTNLQTDIGFAHEYIRIGETKVEIKAIIDYLDWAENIMVKVIDKAKKDGKISH